MKSLEETIKSVPPGCVITQVSVGEYEDLLKRALEIGNKLSQMWLQAKTKRERLECKKLQLLLNFALDTGEDNKHKLAMQDWRTVRFIAVNREMFTVEFLDHNFERM